MSVSTCKFCGNEVVWMMTKSNKKILVDLESCDSEDTVYDKAYMKCHFETCTKQPPKMEKPGDPGLFNDLNAKLDMIQANINEILLKLDKKK